MKILTIIGARPQFIKAAMVSHAIIKWNDAHDDKIEEILLHTGQHYDANMSDVFFTQMKIPHPQIRLSCGGGSHGEMTGKMLIAIEKAIMEHKPDYVMIYGDTDSTLAGALAAAKLNVPVAHVEAGLRSFNRRMPEEINRVLADHVSSLLFCPTRCAVANLQAEGITVGVSHVGDVMYDAALFFGGIAEQTSNILEANSLIKQEYSLATVHRAENTDDHYRLKAIFDAFFAMGTECVPIVLPLHPRTRKALEAIGLLDACQSHPGLRLLPPCSFLDMVMLERHASVILTDSGGVQKEAYFHRVPCVTLRDETEWVETIAAGWNQVVGAVAGRIIEAVRNPIVDRHEIDEYGRGDCAAKIVAELGDG